MSSILLILGKIPLNPPLQRGARGDYVGRIIQTCLILLGLLLLVPSAQAQTVVSGAIASNVRWTVADGSYLINGDVTLQNGAALTIDAGTTVYMARTPASRSKPAASKP